MTTLDTSPTSVIGAMRAVLSDAELIVYRMFRDAVLERLEAYWEARARVFDGVGNASCDEAAAACRAKAYVIRNYGMGDFMEESFIDAWNTEYGMNLRINEVV